MQKIEYMESDTTFEGVFYSGHGVEKKKPCLMIAHAWDGLNEHLKKIASEFSSRGFHAFVIDLYGKGIRGVIEGDNSHLMNPLLEDRDLLHRRLLASFNTAKSLEGVDETQMYILGFCFGGLCALDLARLNPKGLKKSAAVHSLLHAPKDVKLPDKIDAEILLMHGWKDPVAKPEAFLEFCDEMQKKSSNWSAKIYGNAMHAFTMEGAQSPARGILFDKKAASDTFENLQKFFEERH